MVVKHSALSYTSILAPLHRSTAKVLDSINFMANPLDLNKGESAAESKAALLTGMT